MVNAEPAKGMLKHHIATWKGKFPAAHFEACEIAIEALEKQMPKAVIPNKRIEGLGKCPACKTELCIDDAELHYCPTCGQALTV